MIGLEERKKELAGNVFARNSNKIPELSIEIPDWNEKENLPIHFPRLQ